MPTGVYIKTEEHKRKIRIIMEERWAKIKNGEMPDIYHPLGWKEKARKASKKRWDRVGRKKYKRPKHGNGIYRKWTKKVFEYDNYTCWICERRERKLQAHHLFDWMNYPRLRYKISNGLTLCEFCHRTYTEYGMKGKRRSEITKEKLRQRALEQFKNGMPIETRRKISKTKGSIPNTKIVGTIKGRK